MTMLILGAGWFLAGWCGVRLWHRRNRGSFRNPPYLRFADHSNRKYAYAEHPGDKYGDLRYRVMENEVRLERYDGKWWQKVGGFPLVPTGAKERVAGTSSVGLPDPT